MKLKIRNIPKLLFLLTILLFFISCSSNQIETETFTSGEKVIILDNTFIGVGDQKNLDELISFQLEEDAEAIAWMKVDGKAEYVQKGTAATYLEYKIGSSKIEIVDSGVIGWIVNEFIAKHP